MFNGGGVEQPSRSPMDPGVPQLRQQPYVKIIEQPAAKALRFRYECEGRSAGSIPGANSTLEVKSYPTIQVVGFRGKSVVVVSCVTKDSPYKVHPHNLVGREGCKKGVCTLNIPEDTMTVQFTNLGIQCVKKRDIESALRQREEIRVDPFKQGYDHRNQPTSIDLNAVRLCFQVFLETAPGKYTQALKPVVSEPIFDKKAMCELTIVKLSDCVSYVDGGRKDIILLCEKVAKDDIQVRFYEEKNNRVVWEAFAEVQPAQVHKQHAIWFQTPRYHTREVTEPVKVFIQLRRPSDNATSDPLPFELLPLDSGDKGRKRQKIDSHQILNHLAEYDRKMHSPSHYQAGLHPLDAIKTEPRDPSPFNIQGASPVMPHVSPPYYPNTNPSPDLQYNQQFAEDLINIPQAGPSLQPPMASWNIAPIDPIATPIAPIATLGAANQPTIVDMDTGQEVDSATLRSYMKQVEGPLMEINNLSLSEIDVAPVDHNMSDSLTRLANNAHDQMYQQQ